jgi:hypothetical protein
MMTWVWVLIPLVTIVGGLVVEYQKSKMKMMQRSQQNENELGDMRSELQQMRKRIENLEAIAANDPSGFKTSDHKSSEEPILDNFDDVEFKEENRSSVEEMAQRNRNRS